MDPHDLKRKKQKENEIKKEPEKEMEQEIRQETQQKAQQEAAFHTEETKTLFPRYTVLTIAGSDSGGGAGIQADLKTILALGGYGVCAVTALTAQNTQGVKSVFPIPGECIAEQLEAVFDDLPPQAVKIGMLPSIEAIEAAAEALAGHRFLGRPFPMKLDKKEENINLPVVLDPVLASTSGTVLTPANLLKTLERCLFPVTTLLTPNLPEAQSLLSVSINSRAEAAGAARELSLRYGCAVLLKGGHGSYSAEAEDCLWTPGFQEAKWFSSPRLQAFNTHGTGCTLSSAIACGLAQGKSLEESVSSAKKYITGAIASGLNLGRGNGPLNHGYRLRDMLL